MAHGVREDEPMTAKARRKKQAKNKARKEERTALYMAIRVAKRMDGEHFPEYIKGMPNHMLRRYLENGGMTYAT
jgi:hypothetical protein